ncbi:MAG: hypothetical protein L7F78_08285, partial [Syntrophales bacterium LBB04]|nr:hypothetical protein [Syntrophales bacterium LBB04]
MKNSFKNFLSMVVALSALLLPTFGFAEVKEVITEGTYRMSDGETSAVAESRALLQAKRIALEQTGTYLEAYCRDKGLRLTTDEMQVLTSVALRFDVLEKNRTVAEDGIDFWVKIRGRVSTDTIAELAKRVKGKSIIEDFKKIRTAYDNSQKEIAALKKQWAKSASRKEKEQVKKSIAANERLLQANEWFDTGCHHGLNE